jgi:osmotically-inducible protein OsmY
MTTKTSSRIIVACLALSGATMSGCSRSAPPAPARASESAGEVLDDSVITAQLRAALLNEPSLKSFEIGVTTFKDTVQLSGFVDSAGAKELAGRLASGVRGVASVRNDLIVK